MKSFLPSKLYDVLSWLALVALDALGECYKIIAGIWHLPYGQQVFETCVAISVCLGILLGISKVQYNKNKSVSIKEMSKAVADAFNEEEEIEDE